MADDLLTNIRAEIEERLRELEPLLEERRELNDALAALSSRGRKPAPKRARDSGPRAGGELAARAPARKRPRPRGARNPTGRAILAALEHGSHTVAELLVVTGLPAREIRDSLRLLRMQRAIVTTDRENKTAYALPGGGGEGPA